MGNDFQGKAIIVTGAGRGMGADIAWAFAREGGKVMVAARTIRFGEETVAKMRAEGLSAAVCQVDVTKRADIEKLIRATIEEYGRIDIIVHSALDVGFGYLVDVADEDVEKTLATTIKASIWLLQAGYPHLKVADGGGRVVLLSSICGPKTAIRGLGPYAAAKAGLNGLIANAALELAPEGITVNGIEPGITSTARFLEWTPPAQREAAAASIPVGRIGRPEEIARVALFLAHRDSAYITGRTITIDGGLTLSSMDPAHGRPQPSK